VARTNPAARSLQPAVEGPRARSSATGRRPVGGHNRNEILIQVGCALALSAIGGVVIAATDQWKIAVGLIAAAAFTSLGLLRPALFVTVLLAIRPLMDGYPGNPTQLTGVLLIGICALVFATRPQVVRPRAVMAFSALLLVSALSALPAYMDFGNEMGVKPLTELVRLSALFAMYLLAAQVVTTADAARKVFVVVGLSGVIPALAALAELLDDPKKIAQLDLVRVSGTFVNPVALSSYLALCILILVMLPREELSRRIRWPAQGVMIAALVASYGREGWVLLLIALVLLNWRERRRVIAGIAVTCAGLVLLVPGVQARVLPTNDPARTEGSTFASYGWRLANWRGLLNEYDKKPLTGWGLEATVFVNPRRPFGSQRLTDGGFQAHNAAVRALVEGGPLLLGAVIALFVAMISSLWRIARTPDTPLRLHARLAAAAWVAMLIVAMSTDDLLDATALVYALLGLTGALEGAHRRMMHRASREQSRVATGPAW
jgi:O-antigen ligase